MFTRIGLFVVNVKVVKTTFLELLDYVQRFLFVVGGKGHGVANGHLQARYSGLGGDRRLGGHIRYIGSDK